MEKEATPPQPGPGSTLVNTRENRWSEPSGRTHAPGSREVRTAVGALPAAPHMGRVQAGEKRGALSKCRRQWQSRMIMSRESKPLASRLRGGLVLPLLSTLPTTSTCLSRRDPRNKGTWDAGGHRRELDSFPRGCRARSRDAHRARGRDTAAAGLTLSLGATKDG